MKDDRLMDAIGLIDDEMVIDAKKFKKKRLWTPVKKAAVLAASAALCFIISVPALAAAEIEPAQELLYAVAPSIAQKLKPVRKSCVDNGIQMEVVSADIQNDTAEVYIAMKDLEGDRIDGTMDLFDSYDIQGIGDLSGTCRLESYDEKTGVATFLILIQQTDGKKITLDKVTFSVDKFMSHKKVFEDVLPEVSLSSVSRTPETKEHVNLRGGSGKSGQTEFLEPGSQKFTAPVEGAEVSALGYMDGKLHVQMYYEDILNTDNHGWLWLKDKNGNRVECESSSTFWDTRESGSYEEYLFDIPYEKLGDYELYGELTTCDTLTTGDWQVTFSMDDDK